MISHHAVVLLRHSPVEAAQTRLQVRNRNMHLHRTQRRRDRRIRVAVDQHPVRTMLIKHRIQRGKHCPGLHSVRAASDPQMHIRHPDAQILENISDNIGS